MLYLMLRILYKNMFSFVSLVKKIIKKIQSEEVSTGALPDTRPLSEKAKDYLAEEVIAGNANYIPFSNPKITELSKRVTNQFQVSSCVPHAFLTQLEYENVDTSLASRLRLYRKRSGYPYEGSNGVDIYNKIRSGLSFDFPTPENATEAMANAMPYVEGRPFVDFNYYQYIKSDGTFDHDGIIRDVNNGKAVTIFLWASAQEYNAEYVTRRQGVTQSNAVYSPLRRLHRKWQEVAHCSR